MTTDDAADALVTNRHGRAALGIAAANLRRGYDVIATIRPDAWGPFQAGGVLGGIGDADVRTTATDMLDRTNAYAGGLYAMIADTDDPIDEAMRERVRVALSQAQTDLALLETIKAALVATFIGELGSLVTAIGQATLEATRYIADAAKQIVAAVVPAWLWWLLGGAVIVAAGVYAARLSPGSSA